MIKCFEYKNIHCSPIKIRSILFFCKKKSLSLVINQLDFLFKKSAFILKKIFKNILSNLNNIYCDSEFLISEISINKGKILKKKNFFAKGRSGILKKRLSNLIIKIYCKKKKR